MVVGDRLRDHAQDRRGRAQRKGRVLIARAAPRVAITTDWLTLFGGGERVLQHLLQQFPDAPVYTSVYDPSRVPASVRRWTVRQTFLGKLPGVRRYSRLMLPLMPWAFG